MPVYTVVKAKPGESIPYHVFDATGREWLYCCRVDTESGEITRYVMDENGFPVLDEGGWSVSGKP